MSTIRYILPECVCPKVTNQYIVLGPLDTQHQQGLIKQIASERGRDPGLVQLLAAHGAATEIGPEFIASINANDHQLWSEILGKQRWRRRTRRIRARTDYYELLGRRLARAQQSGPQMSKGKLFTFVARSIRLRKQAVQECLVNSYWQFRTHGIGRRIRSSSIPWGDTERVEGRIRSPNSVGGAQGTRI